MTSLWKVADLPTQELMVRFYRYLVGGVGRSAALRQAQREMLPGAGPIVSPLSSPTWLLRPGDCPVECVPLACRCRRNFECAPAIRSHSSGGLLEASWRSGYAAVCKTAYAGSIPADASKLP